MASSSEAQPELSYEDYKTSYLNQLPKFGILIPNRVFVGSIPGNTTESELKQFFSTYGHIKDCKIILDKAGVSKGYGFVTFESAEDVSKLLRQEGEHLFFNERKLNIGPAVRKQQTSVSVLDNGSGGGLLYANGAPFAYPHAYPHLPLMSGDNVGIAGLPTMASASYPLMVNPHQQFLMQPNCNPSMGLATSALQWATVVGASPQVPWPPQTNNCLPMVPTGHFPVAGSSTQLSLPSTSQYFYQYPQLPAVLPSQEMIYPSAANLQYSDGEVNDNASSLDPSCAQSNALIMDSGGVSGKVQYIEISPYPEVASGSAVVPGVVAASIAETLSLAPAVKSSGAAGSNLQKLSASQNYGVKRVLTIPRQVVCAAPSNHYGFYAVPPVKIIAGQGGQRIVTKSVGTTEIQILPKTQL